MNSGEDHNRSWRDSAGVGGGDSTTPTPSSSEFVLVIRSRAKQPPHPSSSNSQSTTLPSTAVVEGHNDSELERSVRGSSHNALIPTLTTQESGLGLGPNEMIMQAMHLLSSVAEKHALPLHIQKGTNDIHAV